MDDEPLSTAHHESCWCNECYARKFVEENRQAAPEFSVGVDTGSAEGTSVVVAQKLPDGAIKIIHSQYYPAPQDQDAKDAALGRYVRRKFKSGNGIRMERIFLTANEVDAAMKQKP